MQNVNTIRGTVEKILDTQTFSSGFSLKNVVIKEDSEYATPIAIQFVKDKISLLDNINVGDEVDINYNIRGAESNGRYFVNLTGWKIDVETPAGSNQHKTAGVTSSDSDDDYNDDIPF